MTQKPGGMMRVTRVELVWPGKYNEDGTRREVPRVSLPFIVAQVHCRPRPRRGTLQARGALQEVADVP